MMNSIQLDDMVIITKNRCGKNAQANIKKRNSYYFIHPDYNKLERKGFVQVSKNLTLDTDLKVILLDHKNNYVER